MALRITDDNYQTYKEVFAILFKHTMGPILLKPDSDPVRILNSWEAKSRSVAKKGLKEGLRDLISALTYYPPQVIANISADLERKRLPTINQLLAIIRDTVRKVLASNSIRTLDQYYIIKELIDDTESEITAENRQQLSECLGTFEEKQRIRKR